MGWSAEEHWPRQDEHVKREACRRGEPVDDKRWPVVRMCEAIARMEAATAVWGPDGGAFDPDGNPTRGPGTRFVTGRANLAAEGWARSRYDGGWDGNDEGAGPAHVWSPR